MPDKQRKPTPEAQAAFYFLKGQEVAMRTWHRNLADVWDGWNTPEEGNTYEDLEGAIQSILGASRVGVRAAEDELARFTQGREDVEFEWVPELLLKESLEEEG